MRRGESVGELILCTWCTTMVLTDNVPFQVYSNCLRSTAASALAQAL